MMEGSYDGPPRDYVPLYDVPATEDDSIFDGPPVDDTSGDKSSMEKVPSSEQEDEDKLDSKSEPGIGTEDNSAENEQPKSVETGICYTFHLQTFIF